MHISHKSNVIQSIHEVEWQCRRKVKGLDKSEYWAWLATVTSEDENGHKTYDFSGEDYEIVETDAPLSYVTKDDEGGDITVPFNQSGHIHSDLDETHYHLKWDGSKVVADDDALAECQLAEKWKNIRLKRSRLLAETDYLAMKDQPDMTNDMQIYRKKLRDLPQDNSDVENITWPTKPS